MSTDIFRRPRADIPIYPRRAIYREEKIIPFRVPKGRRGRKPKRGRLPKKIFLPTRDTKRRILREAKVKEITSNVAHKREELRLKKEVAEEQTRYRISKAEREKQQQAVRVIEGHRERKRQDRLLEAQSGYFQTMIDRQRADTASQFERGERREGQLAEQYKDFIRMIVAERNLEDKAQAEEDIPLHIFEDITTPRDVAETTSTALGTERKRREVKPIITAEQLGAPAPEPEPAEEETPILGRQRSAGEEVVARAFGEAPRRGGVGEASPRAGVQSPLYDPHQTRREEMRQQEGVQPEPSPREFFQAQVKRPALSLSPAEEHAKVSPEVGYGEEEEAIGFGGVVPRRRRTAVIPQEEGLPSSADPNHPRNVALKAQLAHREQVALEKAQPEPEPQPRPKQSQFAKGAWEASVGGKVSIDIDRDTLRQLYQQQAEGGGKGHNPKTDRKIYFTGRQLIKEEGYKRVKTSYDEIASKFQDEVATQLPSEGKGSMYMEITDKIGGAGLERSAGLYKIRQLPAVDGTGIATHSDKWVLQEITATSRKGDVGQINSFKGVGAEGENPLQTGFEEGKVKLYALPQ